MATKVWHPSGVAHRASRRAPEQVDRPPSGAADALRQTWRMAWTRFSLAGAAGTTLDADAVHYGPGLPPEGELKLLGHVEGRRILDLGCGAGAGAVALAKAGARVIAVDEDARNLAATREQAEREGVRVETHHGPLAELAFVRADTIDAAVSIYGLATVDDLDRVFRQVHRVLRHRPAVRVLAAPPGVRDARPGGGEPLLRRTWWDTSPVAWSVAAERRRARPRPHARRAVREPGPGQLPRSTPCSSRRPTGPPPATAGPTRCGGCRRR